MSGSLYSPSWYRVAELKPRLRTHCQIHRHSYRGELWYVLQNLVTGRFHRFPPNVYFIMGLMDGKRSLQQIWESAAEKLADDVPSQQEVIQLLTQLFNADVLQTDVFPVIEEMQNRSQKMQRQKNMQHLRSPLSIKIPLFDPDRLLSALLPWFRWCFTPAVLLIWVLVIISGIVLAAQYWEPLTENVVDRALSLENILLLWFVFPVVKILHELGHGLAVKHWGGEVHELGIMFLVFMPVPYIDASASSGFQQKRRRVLVAAGGLIVELFLAVMALLIWMNAEPGMTRAVAFNIMLIAGVSAILFNGNPLLRYDSYYILSDLVEIPNLGGRANQYIAYLIQKYIFRAPAAHSPVLAEGEKGWLFFYAIASFCYRMLMMVSIVLMVGGQYFIVGTVLAVWSLYSMLLQPLFKTLKALFVSHAIASVRKRSIAIVGCVIAITSTAIMLVPVPASVRVEGVVWAAEKTMVRPEVNGTIAKVVAVAGSQVQVGDELIEINNLQLQADVEIYQAQLKEVEVRYSQEIISDRAKAQITRQEIVAVKGLLQRSIERQESLKVRSQKAGVFIVEQVEDLSGRYVQRGDVLAYIMADNEDIMLRVVVNQDQANLVRHLNRQVEVHFSGNFDQIINATIQREVPAATDEIPSTVLTTEGGGLHATVPGKEGQLKTAQRLFQFEVALDENMPTQRIGERVYVKFIRAPEALGVQAYRLIRQLFLSRFSV